jgi:ribosomal protein S18 acetylase RimI-like enzyme
MIKYLEKEDIEEYLDLLKDSLTMAPDSFAETHPALNASLHFEAFIKVPKSEKFILGFWDEGELVGMIEFERGRVLKTQHTGTIGHLFVHPGYRKQGIGKSLLFECIKNAKVTSRIKLIYLVVIENSESAYNLFEKVGFHEFGIKPRAIKVKDQYFTETLMYLEI